MIRDEMVDGNLIIFDKFQGFDQKFGNNDERDQQNQE